MYGKGRGDTLKGFVFGLCDDTDGLYGQGGNDKLFGGDGDDALSGGPGNDALSGGPNFYRDVYYFENNSWGNDTITDSPGSLSGWGNTGWPVKKEGGGVYRTPSFFTNFA